MKSAQTTMEIFKSADFVTQVEKIGRFLPRFDAAIHQMCQQGAGVPLKEDGE